jgi:ribonuclease BN (tRNA processing enzyme)
MKIKILGAHNTESRNTKHSSLLVDDILALDAGGLTSSLSFRDQLKIKALLLTHHHYDHMRDIPALGMNFYLRNKSVHIYTHHAAYDKMTKYLDGEIYPVFQERPEAAPALTLHVLEHYQKAMIDGYAVLPVPLNHSIPAVGYQITSPGGKTIFYSGDTGPDLSAVWEYISPEVLFIEVTASNHWSEFARKAGHLTPDLLQQALISFLKIKGYLPQVIAVHLNPLNETDIKPQLAALAKSLGTNIRPAHEGMVVEI